MARHVFVRRSRARRAAVAVAASAVLATGLSPLLPSASAAEAPQETVVPATLRSTYTSATLLSPSTQGGHDGAGAQGVFHTVEGGSGWLWTRYADGVSVPVPQKSAGRPQGTGTDVLAYKGANGLVEFWDATDGSTRSVLVPAGLGYVTAYDNLVVANRTVTGDDGTSRREMHLLTPGPDGTTRDVTVDGLPAGLNPGLPAGADADSVFFRATLAGEQRLLAVDRATGRAQSWSGPLPSGYTQVNISPEHVVVSDYDDPTVLVFPRDDLSATPAEVRLANTALGVNATHDLTVVGDWLVNGVTRVTAQPLSGGAAITLMPTSSYGMISAPGGTAVKIGRTAADDWGIQRIQAGPDGTPVVTQVKALPKPPARIQGLSLEQGRLVVVDGSRGGVRDDYLRTVAVTGTPSFGERSDFTPRIDSDVEIGFCPATDVSCSQVFGTADGRIAWLEHTSSATEDLLRVNGPTGAGLWEKAVPAGGRITDVSGAYVLYTDTDKQYVYRIGESAAPVLTRTPGAAALSGNVLWTAGATPGSVTAYDLAAKKTVETFTTDAGCAPAELQALGRWLYWSCGGKAGVYDRTAKKSVSVPTGEAKLGDGFVVTHDKQAGRLTLTTVADGTPASRVIGELPDTGVSQRDVRWTVDEAGENAAFADGQERVHLVPSGVAQQPLRLLGPARSASTVQAHTGDTVPDTLTSVLLSKPSSDWKLTVRNRATGKVYGNGLDGEAARGELTVGWHGEDPTRTGEAFLPNGSYDWTLTVTPADGVGVPLQARGTVRLTKGDAVRRDHVGPAGAPDGVGDLLTLNSSGTLTFQQGTGKGTFSGKVSGSNWPTSVKAVPVGDLSGDRCNDVLVRFSSGALRLYKPGCGKALTPSTSYTTLGSSGWTQYDVLTAPGDVTQDGRPDLIARNSSTGAVYLYKGTSTGKLSARVKLYDNWKTYKKIVGVGDLNGDGIGDLLAQDKANTVYRYYGKGNGTFSARTKLFGSWGGSYNVVVGAGDITGDGRADLVSRDTSGNLYRNNGDGKGSFGGRTKIASGWQGYKGVF
ncbi:FG-GAP repeat domain-containing protein [Streptomyces cellulosae]|uniref:FG-GAP repeat domain-containing protein n=1 Tax=Streptomyces cellulosae TaxID=1968 RepID=A0ABW7YHM2_STRCE